MIRHKMQFTFNIHGEDKLVSGEYIDEQPSLNCPGEEEFLFDDFSETDEITDELMETIRDMAQDYTRHQARNRSNYIGSRRLFQH